MKYIKHSELIKIKQHLKNGGVIAYATESCYGLGCNPFNYRAIAKIINIKRRSKTKGMIVISGNKQNLTNIVKVNLDSKDFDEYWPGSYSIILPSQKTLPRNLSGSRRTIAVRITRHKQIIQLTTFLGIPLVSTSANLSGMKPINNYRECMRKFGTKAMVINGDTNFAKKPSTIIDWNTKKILR